MILKLKSVESEISFTEKNVNVLEVLDKKQFYNIIYDINNIINTGEDIERMVCLKDGIRLNSEKIFLMNNLFDVDVNNKKILKKLNEEIEEVYKFNYEDHELTIELGKILKEVYEIVDELDFKLDFKREIDLKDILKIINIKFDKEYYNNPMENILLLFEINSLFNFWNIIILVNPKIYFLDKEMVEIYKMAKYKKQNILIITPQKNNMLEYEKKVLVDEDFDEFIYEE
ncbi:MAG: type II-A CRISPR-associated protein Csn2 [Clostridium sp.]